MYGIASTRIDFQKVRKPFQDLQFAACVVQFGMLLKNSRYASDSNIEDVIDRLSELDLRDEYRKAYSG